MKTLSKIIKDNAVYLTDVEIEIDYAMGWVNIIDSMGFYDSIFLQGVDGYNFIDEAKKIYNALGDVTMTECLKTVARPYVECLWH